MAQGHIIEIPKDSGVHVIRASHGDFLRIAAAGPGDKLVGHQHISFRRIHLHLLQGRAYRVGIGFDFLIRKESAHQRGLHKGQKVQADRPEFILQHKGLHMSAVRGRDVDAAPAHESAPEGEPFRRIVIAADDKDLLPFPGQPVQELVKKLHRLG